MVFLEYSVQLDLSNTIYFAVLFFVFFVAATLSAFYWCRVRGRRRGRGGTACLGFYGRFRFWGIDNGIRHFLNGFRFFRRSEQRCKEPRVLRCVWISCRRACRRACKRPKSTLLGLSFIRAFTPLRLGLFSSGNSLTSHLTKIYIKRTHSAF